MNGTKKLLVLIIGPSGSGKTTLEKNLLKDYSDHYEKVISHTTRKPRKNEKHGEDYYFISKEKFEEKANNNEFVEIVEFGGNKYGCSKEELLKTKNILLVVEPDGMMQILKVVHSDDKLKKTYKPVIVFMDILDKERRKNMENRGDSSDEIEKRLNDRIKEQFLEKNILPDVLVRRLYKTVHKDIHSQLSLFKKIYI